MNTKTRTIRWRFLALTASFLASQASAPAQGPTEISGPIDIVANEQEFSGEEVIARGNVKVKYKDSLIVAPLATLYRDAGGSPQKAVFTGHPRLVQGQNSIDADRLVFEMSNNRILAEGNAHSEVVSSDEGGSGADAAKAGEQKASGKAERIITDSDRQEYDKAADKFEAVGHVRVRHGDITVVSEKLRLVYGANKKPETAIFTGNVIATQGKNKTSADTITYSLTTKRLQASGNVKSQVIQEKADADKKGGPDTSTESGGKPGKASIAEVAEDTPIIITSDSQDYSQETGRVAADGNVRVYYKDTIGMGPKAVLVRNSEGKAERVVFTGRSAVSQPGRRWIADRITLTVADRKVLAEGNTKALILKTPGQNQPVLPGEDNSQLAGRSYSVSSSRIEATQ